MKKCIIIGNGKPPQKKVINFLIKKGYNTIIAADGGANKLLKYNLTPDIIIGDLDSVDKLTLDKFKDLSKIIKIQRQNDTDIEKSLKYAIKSGFNEAILLGVTGDRLDHTICNIGIVLKFSEKIEIKLISENSILMPFNKKIEFPTTTNETISLYGFNNINKIKTEGLFYPLKNENLSFGGNESTSNKAISDKVKIEIKNGIVFVIRDLNTVIKNDFIF